MITLSANFYGENVIILDIDVNGHSVYVTYKDSNNNLKVARTFFSGETSASNIIATDVVIV